MELASVLILACSTITAMGNPIPQSPYFSFNTFPVPSAVPDPYIPPHTFYHKPAPLYQKPAPVYPKPAPVYHKPTPIYHKPAPLYHKPTPVTPKPAPIYFKPITVPDFSQYVKHPSEEKAPLKPFVNLTPYKPSSTTSEPAATEKPAATEEPEAAYPSVQEVVVPRESDKSSMEERMKIMSQVVSILEDVVEVMEEEEDSKDEDGDKVSEKLIVKTMTDSETANQAPETNEKTPLSETELLEMAMERLREMEELVEEEKEKMEEEEKEELAKDGLVVLEPQVMGEIVSVSDQSEMDGMNIVDFEEK